MRARPCWPGRNGRFSMIRAAFGDSGMPSARLRFTTDLLRRPIRPPPDPARRPHVVLPGRAPDHTGAGSLAAYEPAVEPTAPPASTEHLGHAGGRGGRVRRLRQRVAPAAPVRAGLLRPHQPTADRG